jgi:K+ transporter
MKSRGVSAGTRSLPLSLVALGVVFGDIGTSPLYAFKECLRDGATPTDVYSFVSLILWSLILLVSIKYVGIGIKSTIVLGSVFLAVTGGEALYADMGHFGRAPIQLAWNFFVFPSLALNYLGQGALVLSSPEAATNPFFRLAPDWALWMLVVLATAATVIASQALISGRLFINFAGDPNGLPAADPGDAHLRRSVGSDLYPPRQCSPCRCLRYARTGISEQLRVGFRLRDRCHPDDVDHDGPLFLCR